MEKVKKISGNAELLNKRKCSPCCYHKTEFGQQCCTCLRLKKKSK